MTQQLIDERRNLNRMAQDQLRAIKTLVGDQGYSRTQEIRKDVHRAAALIHSYKELSKVGDEEDSNYQHAMRSNFNKSASLLGLPSVSQFDNSAEYIQLLKDKHTELSGLIQLEFPEQGDQILAHYAEYDRLTMQSTAIKINMNSDYGRSV